MKDLVKEIKVSKLLGDMMKADMELYEKILDTPGFALAFNELTKLAMDRTDNTAIIYTEAEAHRLAFLAFAKGYMEPIISDTWDTDFFQPWLERHKKK